MQLSLSISSCIRNSVCEQFRKRPEILSFFVVVVVHLFWKKDKQLLRRYHRHCLVCHFGPLLSVQVLKCRTSQNLWVKSINSFKKLAKKKPEHVWVIDNCESITDIPNKSNVFATSSILSSLAAAATLFPLAQVGDVLFKKQQLSNSRACNCICICRSLSRNAYTQRLWCCIVFCRKEQALLMVLPWYIAIKYGRCSTHLPIMYVNCKAMNKYVQEHLTVQIKG